jgi:outer membrane protein assembly factor BamA
VPLSRRYGISIHGFYDAAAITGDGRAQAGASVGFGILWRSPIGNLRFDWAFPLDGDGKPHFVFGL